MKHDVKAPSVGESITEVSILKWHKQSGQQVRTGDLLLEIETDKATVEIVAEATGALTILKPAGERIPVGERIASIDDSVTGTAGASQTTATTPAPSAAASAHVAAAPASAGPQGAETALSPAVRKAVTEQGLDASKIPGTGKDGRVTKGDVIQYASGAGAVSAGQPSVAQGAPVAPVMPAAARGPAPAVTPAPARPGERRVTMSMLRSRIAERLVQAQHTAAILTTFNEADMSAINAIRAKNKEAFKARHGVSLGFMSFFTKASIAALKAIPEVNASIDGRDVVYHDYYDIGVAVGTDRGLVVPVLRDADKLGFAEIEKSLAALALKARDGKLSIADMSGGTFTISNGGVYGSLLSTPILNMPQSGILGMHKIQERPVAVNGKVEIRPMMYLALSYDHRLIDGKGAVTFLVTLKDHLENPEKLGLDF
ncbi:MAG: 2-oxoglutarate dehydrogenase complex dihydrolipoyllysine-residue succinyltransferase [Oligoflexia bacterium]|nr:2-oxoglutarate dehydrogenase complex dihydrolipoyllysine-residue succinyltransferase [Oligoflexia bacterium]